MAAVADVNGLYRAAPQLTAAGERIVSTDELTGVQALERLHPGLPLAPGKVERREFEYVRHGTRALIVSRDVASGQIVAPSCGPTRTEADFLAHVRGVVASDPAATRWHFVLDNLNTHQSEALVRFVAQATGRDHDLGVKGKSGILAGCKQELSGLGRQTAVGALAGWTERHGRRPAAALEPGTDCCHGACAG